MPDEKGVGQTGGKCVVSSILHVDDIEASWVFLAGDDNANTPQITTTNDHAEVSNFKGNSLRNLSGLEIELDGVVRLDERVGIADGARIIGDQKRHSLGPHLNVPHSAQLVLGLGGRDSLNGKAPLCIVQQTEILVCLLD